MSDNKSESAQMSEQERALFSEKLNNQANLNIEQEVPNWHRAEAFEQHFKDEVKNKSRSPINWGLWFGVPALSMACSALAITVVMNLFIDQGNNQGSNQQALVAFIDQQVKQQLAQQVNKQLASQNSSHITGQLTARTNGDIEALVTLKLREYAAEQQVIMANYRADMSVEQQKSNLALASYVIGASRKERKEDMNDFINFINAQREDEQLSQKIKFQQLEREVGFQKLGLHHNSKEKISETSLINYDG